MLLSVSLRGAKSEFPLERNTLAGDVKKKVASSSQIASSEIKLLCKGKVVSNNVDLFELLTLGKEIKNPNKVYRLIATGISSSEAKQHNEDLIKGKSTAPRIRDDLTAQGRATIARRQRLGKQMMEQVARKEQVKDHTSGKKTFGFGKVVTLQQLPDEPTARHILDSLANDPGILACMKKREWNVGSLVEMYPDGKVGESPVCVMGLNVNKGQEIQLRIRTDDLKGFRKILSIRDVLFHELSHNVHSDHSPAFWELMSEVKKECNEMDWTQGNGASVEGTSSTTPFYNEIDRSTGRDSELMEVHGYQGGVYRLGERDTNLSSNESSSSKRELARKAALARFNASTTATTTREDKDEKQYKSSSHQKT